jgi:hypothetical protein
MARKISLKKGTSVKVVSTRLGLSSPDVKALPIKGGYLLLDSPSREKMLKDLDSQDMKRMFYSHLSETISRGTYSVVESNVSKGLYKLRRTG